MGFLSPGNGGTEGGVKTIEEGERLLCAISAKDINLYQFGVRNAEKQKCIDKNKPAKFNSDGHSETWLHTLIAEALPSITMQRYEQKVIFPNELQEESL